MASSFMTFEDALEELQLDAEELKRMVSDEEIRAFRDGGQLKFKRDEVILLKEQRETQPTIILPAEDQDPFEAAPAIMGLGDEEEDVPAIEGIQLDDAEAEPEIILPGGNLAGEKSLELEELEELEPLGEPLSLDEEAEGIEEIISLDEEVEEIEELEPAEEIISFDEEVEEIEELEPAEEIISFDEKVEEIEEVVALDEEVEGVEELEPLEEIVSLDDDSEEIEELDALPSLDSESVEEVSDLDIEELTEVTFKEEDAVKDTVPTMVMEDIEQDTAATVASAPMLEDGDIGLKEDTVAPAGDFAVGNFSDIDMATVTEDVDSATVIGDEDLIVPIDGDEFVDDIEEISDEEDEFVSHRARMPVEITAPVHPIFNVLLVFGILVLIYAGMIVLDLVREPVEMPPYLEGLCNSILGK